jgi:hypothetical protein
MRRRTRRSVSTIRAGTPDMTIGHADADQTGARPYLRRDRNNSLTVSPFLERFLDRTVPNLSAVRQYGNTVDLDQNFD